MPFFVFSWSISKASPRRIPVVASTRTNSWSALSRRCRFARISFMSSSVNASRSSASSRSGTQLAKGFMPACLPSSIARLHKAINGTMYRRSVCAFERFVCFKVRHDFAPVVPRTLRERLIHDRSEDAPHFARLRFASFRQARLCDVGFEQLVIVAAFGRDELWTFGRNWTRADLAVPSIVQYVERLRCRERCARQVDHWPTVRLRASDLPRRVCEG